LRSLRGKSGDFARSVMRHCCFRRKDNVFVI
jgi:hypothetical protein